MNEYNNRTIDCCTHSLLHAQQDPLTQYNETLKPSDSPDNMNTNLEVIPYYGI
jgi:hypothetical protein